MSEASHIFDPQLLTPIICELAQEVNPLKFQNGLNDLDMTLVAVDGTLLKALPKMLWALWLDEDHRAAKVHLEFDILKGIPIQAQVTHANKSEIAQLESALAPGKLYCLDAGYGEYRFLDKIIQQPSSFVMRLRDNGLLIRLWTGRKPTKRTFEMICLYFQGWASLEELIGHIEGLKSQDQKQQ